MVILANEKGWGSYKLLFLLLLVFCFFHVGLKLAPMYMDAERMKDEMTTRARFASTNRDEEIIADLVKKAKELDLPLGQGDFKLMRDDANRRMKISVTWDEEIHFFFDVYPPYTVKTFHFEQIAEEHYAN
jgi:hypothetical protein